MLQLYIGGVRDRRGRDHMVVGFRTPYQNINYLLSKAIFKHEHIKTSA
jgi:hypothetical protein